MSRNSVKLENLEACFLGLVFSFPVHLTTRLRSLLESSDKCLPRVSRPGALKFAFQHINWKELLQASGPSKTVDVLGSLSPLL